jgi:hypothetical protein
VERLIIAHIKEIIGVKGKEGERRELRERKTTMVWIY